MRQPSAFMLTLCGRSVVAASFSSAHADLKVGATSFFNKLLRKKTTMAQSPNHTIAQSFLTPDHYNENKLLVGGRIID